MTHWLLYYSRWQRITDRNKITFELIWSGLTPVFQWILYRYVYHLEMVYIIPTESWGRNSSVQPSPAHSTESFRRNSQGIVTRDFGKYLLRNIVKNNRIQYTNFLYIFWWAKVCWPLRCLCLPFVFLRNVWIRIFWSKWYTVYSV